MKKINLEKCEELSDVFCAIMGGRPDNINEIEAFMATNPLKDIIHFSDIDRILNFDGFFAEETIDAVYALLPIKIQLSATRNWIMSPQAFRKLNNVRVNRPASRLINISFPKALEIYNKHYLSKIQNLIQTVHEIQQKKNSQANDNVAVSQKKDKPNISTPKDKKELPPIVARQMTLAKEQKKKLKEEQKRLEKEKLKQQREFERSVRRQKKEEQKEAERERKRIKREIAREERRQLKEIEKEKQRQKKALELAQKEKQRRRKNKRILKKAREEQEKRREQREILKKQQIEENELLIKEEKRHHKEAQRRQKRKQEAQRKKLAETNPELAERREKNRLQMQKRRAENPDARKSYYVKYEDLSEEEREKKRQANRERNRRYREAHRLELRKAHNERRAKLKAEDPDLLKALDRVHNLKANRQETGRRYYQNHKEEIDRRTRENPMRPVYLQRYEEKQKHKKLTDTLLLKEIKDKRIH